MTLKPEKPEFFKDQITINSDLYVSTTNGVEVAVRPEFLDSQSSLIGEVFVWAYHVRIENKSNDTVQLISRYWKIVDARGLVQEVSGEGAVGEKPILPPGGVFEYTSGVHLRFHSGIMSGHYTMKKATGEFFEVKIPAFSLDTPNLKDTIN